MFSLQYKPGWFINGYFDRPECYWVKADNRGFCIALGKSRTLLEAKRYITKMRKTK